VTDRITAPTLLIQGEPGIGRLIDTYTGHLESEPLFASIAPGARILLVEANSATYSDLGKAENLAAGLNGT